MKEEDKKPESEAAGEPVTDQKSDKSPEELMSKVANEDTSLDSGSKKSAVDAMADDSNADHPEQPKKPEQKGIKKLISKLNIYLLLFIFIVVLSGASAAVFYFMNKREQNTRIETTELTEAALEELKTSDATVGDPKQILTIESHAVISGKVIMKDTLDIAGALKIGGPLSLPSIRAGGEGNFGTLATNDLQAAGNVSVGGILDVVGAVTIGSDVTASGNANFGGKLDVGGQATIDGNLNVNGIISAQGLNFGSVSMGKINITGSQPGISPGGAAGSGATTSVSGTDTAGTATINTGGGTGTGILATINFTSAYSTNNPHPVLTPNGPGCASIAYYVTNISASQFSIATASAPPAGTACRFNYIVIN